MSSLNVWMNGELVGTWTENRGSHTLTYDVHWVESERARPLSLSLPITANLTLQGDAVRNYFDNLLPDNAAIRERVRRKHHARSTEVFDLLAAIGRDCVGAVQLLPNDVIPEGVHRIDSEPLTDAEVERVLQDITSDGTVLGMDDGGDFRISIAGAQEKTALLKLEDQWHLPKGATPTTHILKLPLGLIGGLQVDMRHSIENEWLCLRLLGLLGLPVAKAEMATFGAQNTLVVERFDRARVQDPRWIARLPQEDFCQASGCSPRQKYESHGGPGLNDCMRLLGGSRRWHTDQSTFLLTQLAFWLMAAIDGHSKNFSIFHERGGTYAMTPLYDVLSAWPVIGHGKSLYPRSRVTMAMAIRSKSAHYRMVDIQPRHWAHLAKKSGLRGIEHAMQVLVEGVDAALEIAEATLPAGFPDHVWTSIAEGMRAQALRFSAGFADS